MQESLKPKRAMVRKQIFITAEQNARLKAAAAASGKAEGELVRAGIDKLLAEQDAAASDWKAAWGQAAGIWADRTDIDELMANRRAARKKRRERTAREWAK